MLQHKRSCQVRIAYWRSNSTSRATITINFRPTDTNHPSGQANYIMPMPSAWISKKFSTVREGCLILKFIPYCSPLTICNKFLINKLKQKHMQKLFRLNKLATNIITPWLFGLKNKPATSLNKLYKSQFEMLHSVIRLHRLAKMILYTEYECKRSCCNRVPFQTVTRPKQSWWVYARQNIPSTYAYQHDLLRIFR